VIVDDAVAVQALAEQVKTGATQAGDEAALADIVTRVEQRASLLEPAGMRDLEVLRRAPDIERAAVRRSAASLVNALSELEASTDVELVAAAAVSGSRGRLVAAVRIADQLREELLAAQKAMLAGLAELALAGHLADQVERLARIDPIAARVSTARSRLLDAAMGESPLPSDALRDYVSLAEGARRQAEQLEHTAVAREHLTLLDKLTEGMPLTSLTGTQRQWLRDHGLESQLVVRLEQRA
jgi:hypothetical protein